MPKIRIITILLFLVAILAEYYFGDNTSSSPYIGRLIIRFFHEDDFGWSIPSSIHMIRNIPNFLLSVIPGLHEREGGCLLTLFIFLINFVQTSWKAEVADLHVAILVDQDVPRFDISMDYVCWWYEIKRTQEFVYKYCNMLYRHLGSSS